MPYAPFSKYFPDLAENETRSITVTELYDLGLPSGVYSFIEMFCDENGCDCRRVFFYVISSFRKKVEAVIAWGWEDEEFYKKWMKDDDPKIISSLKGPILNAASPQSKYALPILELVEDVLLQDKAYIERVKRHYKMFREKVDLQDKQIKIGRNEPCLCGSGKKYKKCCGN